jgi:predicted DsbA family dithiol-disulfide isomerase
MFRQPIVRRGVGVQRWVAAEGGDMTRLEIISDVACPWCYIGKAHLDRALAAAGNPFAVRWRPFRLEPDMPEQGMDHRAYYAAKFGEDRAQAIRERVTEAGAAAGLTIRFERIGRAINTLDAHRVMRWAEPEGAQHGLAGVLFRRYFEDGWDLSDHGRLAEAAAEAGMNRDVVTRLLAGDADRASVRDEARAAGDMGVTGVPTFIVGGRYAVSGAQPPEVWVKLIDELAAARSAMGRRVMP